VHHGRETGLGNSRPEQTDHAPANGRLANANNELRAQFVEMLQGLHIEYPDTVEHRLHQVLGIHDESLGLKATIARLGCRVMYLPGDVASTNNCQLLTAIHRTSLRRISCSALFP